MGFVTSITSHQLVFMCPLWYLLVILNPPPHVSGKRCFFGAVIMIYNTNTYGTRINVICELRIIRTVCTKMYWVYTHIYLSAWYSLPYSRVPVHIYKYISISTFINNASSIFVIYPHNLLPHDVVILQDILWSPGFFLISAPWCSPGRGNGFMVKRLLIPCLPPHWAAVYQLPLWYVWYSYFVYLSL